MQEHVVEVTSDDERAAELASLYNEQTFKFHGEVENPTPQQTADTIQSIAIYAAAVLSKNPFAIDSFIAEVKKMATLASNQGVSN